MKTHNATSTPAPAACQPDVVREGILYRAVADLLGCSNGKARRCVRAGQVFVNGLIEEDENRAVTCNDSIGIISARRHDARALGVTTRGRIFPSSDDAGS